MNRRLLLATIFGAFSNLILGKLSRRHRTAHSSRFTVKDFYRSEKYPNKIYSSTNEFWKDHYEKTGDSLNTQYISDGKLLNKKSYLLPDHQTVAVIRVFKNENCYHALESLKTVSSHSSPKTQMKYWTTFLTS